MIRVLILEDERYTAKDLANTLRAIDDQIEVLPVLQSFEDADFFFSQSYQIDLIFSDIDLGDGMSLELFKKHRIEVPVIFCTAHAEYSREAFQTFAIHYLVKPFSKQDVEQALQKYYLLSKRFSGKGRTASGNIEPSILTVSENRAILVHSGEKILPIELSAIAFFTIEYNEVFLYTFDKRKYHCSESLEQLEEMAGTDFFRVNRQYLINRKAIQNAVRHFNRKLLVTLTIPHKEQILVGKLKLTTFLAWLKGTIN